MAIITKVQYKCDFCDNPVTRKNHLNVPLSCVRRYEDAEGRYKIEPCVEIAYVDLCEEHFNLLYNFDIYGAQGFDDIKGSVNGERLDTNNARRSFEKKKISVESDEYKDLL